MVQLHVVLFPLCLKNQPGSPLPGRPPSQAGVDIHPSAHLCGSDYRAELQPSDCLFISPLLWVLEHRAHEPGLSTPAVHPLGFNTTIDCT